MARLQMDVGGGVSEEKAIKFENFMGVDFTSSKLNVANNRAVDMKNLIYENGLNRKRPNWNEVVKGSGKVNGVWKYIAPNKSIHIITHIETKLYKVLNRDNESAFDVNSVYTQLQELTLPDGVELTDDISYGVMNDEKLFLLCGAYLVYDGTEVKKVTDIAYIPTTVMGISAVGSTVYADKKTPFEKVNLLSEFETVTLFAEDTFNETPLSYTNPQVYWLNRGFVGTNATGFKLTIKTIVENEPTTIEPTLVYSDGKIYFNDGINTIGEIDGNRFEMHKYYAPQKEGTPNLIFTYRTRQFDNTIDKCTFGTILNAQGGQFLFLSGNPDKPNFDWHSDYGLTTNMKTISDFTYFPETSYTAIGNHTEKNVGYTILGDGTMAIHKEATTNKDILYIRTSFLGNALSPSGEVVTDLNNNVMKEVFFSTNQSAIGEGMIARHTSDNLLGDNLFLSRNGIFGLSLASNITSSERYALDRSWLINGKLTQEENLKNACAIAYNNRYYLAVNGNCYVADARFKNYLSTDMPDTFSYEWWFWENIHARLFFVIDNELYFGTDNGQICKFEYDEHRVDKQYVAIESITFSDNEFTIDTAYSELIESLKESDGVRIKAIVGSEENDLLFDFNGTTYPIDFECEIMDYDNGTFKLYSHTYEGEKVAYEVNAPLETSNFKAYFVLRNRVEDLFITKVTDLGNPTYTKQITTVTATPEKIINSALQVGIRTRNFVEKYLDVENAGLFDFERIDFANFTFNTDNFPTSFTKRVKTKCNYVQFMLRSTNEIDCGLHNIIVNYKIIKKNKGER